MQQDTRPKRTYDLEGLEELICSLVEASLLGAAIIVEGRRDLEALRSLGLQGPVIMASRQSALDLGRGCRQKLLGDNPPHRLGSKRRCDGKEDRAAPRLSGLAP